MEIEKSMTAAKLGRGLELQTLISNMTEEVWWTDNVICMSKSRLGEDRFHKIVAIIKEMRKERLAELQKEFDEL